MAEELEARFRATARRALGDWDLDIREIELVSQSENVVLRLTTDSGENYALRIHRPGYNTLDELNSELLWTQALRKAGIYVPTHLLTRDGRGYATVPLEGTNQDHHVGVIEWVEGEQLAGLIDAAEEANLLSYFKQLGDVIARTHNHVASWTVPEDFTRRAWDADGLVGDSPLWGRFWQAPQLDPEGSQLLYTARKEIHRILIDYGRSPETYGLTHADLHPRNVLVDGKHIQVIDFDDCGFGWHHYDIAVALHDYRYRSNYIALRDALVRGYRNVRNLAQDVVDLLPMFFLIRSLVSLAWVNGRPEFRHADWIPFQAQTTCEETRGFLNQ
jgi:Ser/Thr protein kinase RdoA (MazF antagonist)